MPGRHTATNDLRNEPAYPLGEAARYLKLPPATLRAWTLGRPYPTARGAGHFRPLIRAAAAQPALLSFWNLIEAHLIRALRTEHGVSIKDLRHAIDFAERKLGVERLLLQAHLKRVSWDKARAPFRLHPFLVGDATADAMPIAIDPTISFGRPVVISRGITTAAIVARIDAGETPEDLARDYDLSQAEVEQAVLYERAA